ncbi:hypothetical protein GCM10011521_03140 [Arenimonas soli]|uniref:DUF4179 domain-containing protein n=1 Tax=Arenimonas soli TaxID=2269504 RepID=A0ABQ1HAQ8_9GAMM|nr:hypothetical protein [Arenimonas soli]GGA68340.1 hypothetical protein GCM10011521_03140 [Arenimonas soli]
MSKLSGHELSPTLAARVKAAKGEPSPAAIEQAQQALMRRLHSEPPARRRTRGPLFAAAATAMLALVAFIAVPLLSSHGEAFAAVQRHFLDFNTLSMRVEQRVHGEIVQTSRMVVDAQGVVRTDVGEELSVIVDPGHERVLMLLHGPRHAMLSPLQGAKPSPDASLHWLEELRAFEGRAELLPGTRLFDGHVARGWSLQIEGSLIVLWADADGLPLAMQMGQPGEMGLTFHFEFDQPVPRGHLSSQVPAGYVLAEPDPD